MSSVPPGPFSWDKVIRAVEKVRERLLRATSALDQAGLPYAVTEGNAVAVWVARIDEGAVPTTPDVDVLLRRSDLEAAGTALTAAGFLHAEVNGMTTFLDGPRATPRDAVHILFANEKVLPQDLLPAADVSESEPSASFRVVKLDALVRMKLTSYRRKDRVHLRDLLDVGLIDASWPARFPPELAARLQQLIDDPNG